MKVERIFDGGKGMYPYSYRIVVPPDNLTPLDVVIAWAQEQGIKCCIMPGVTYVRTEQDALLFLLRWAK